MGSLAEARERLERRSPDVALLDLQLPDGHGLQLLDTIKESEGTWKVGRQHGTWTRWGRDGAVQLQWRYDEGVQLDHRQQPPWWNGVADQPPPRLEPK